ncbi:MAG: DUF72 domain-containing protein [Candidatus Dormiibacterota bacterium]
MTARTGRLDVRRHIGTSGWQYADWRDVLYPKGLPQRRWLERYAEVFDTVEINNTFYGLPAPATAAKWSETVPSDFIFALKMSRYVTHRANLQDVTAPIRQFMDRLSSLGAHTGPILVQLPPSRTIDERGLDAILAALPATAKVAVELRHPSWFEGNSIRALLERRRAALVWADRGGRMLNPPWVTTDWLYLRLHGGRGRAGNYGPRTLGRYASLLATMDHDAYVYFNNDAMGNAVRNALALATRLREVEPPQDVARPPLRPGIL